jgi:hypothetical protein
MDKLIVNWAGSTIETPDGTAVAEIPEKDFELAQHAWYKIEEEGWQVAITIWDHEQARTSQIGGYGSRYMDFMIYGYDLAYHIFVARPDEFAMEMECRATANEGRQP